MRKLGRREFLLGLGAGTAMAALGPKSWGRFSAPETAAAGVRTLNVLIHGMFVVEIGNTNQGITLYAPIAPDNSHVYEAGNWEAERSIPKFADLRLVGVKGGGRPTLDQLHYHENPVFPRGTVNPRFAYFTFHLPFPDKFAFLRVAHGKQGVPFFHGTPAPYDHPVAIPEVPVFIYWNVKGTPAIHTLPWTPDFSNGYANLHVWAMRAGVTTSGHIAQTFPVLAKLMGHPNVKPSNAYLQLPPPRVDAHTGVAGVPPPQEETLNERPVLPPRKKNSKNRPPYSCSSVFTY